MPRIDCGDRREAGQRQTECFGGAGHRRRGAHRHAMARRARDAALDTLPLLFSDFAGAQFGPVFPRVRTAAQRAAVPVASQHRPRWQIDGRQIHADRAHQQTGRGLVATAHQHTAVERIGLQQFLGFHREEVAIQHRGRFLERLGERHHRHFDRKATGLPDAALHFFDALFEVRVARVDLAPRVDDGDHRLAHVIRRVVTHLRGARTVAERAQIVHAVPAVAAKLLRCFAGR